MNDHDGLVRSLLAGKSTFHLATTVPASTQKQVARAMAHERHRAKAPDSGRAHRRDDTNDARRTR